MAYRPMSLCSMLAATAFSSAAFAGGNPACDSATHSCDTTGGPGCTDVDCCNLVCDADAFCCATLWDTLCVDGAAALCVASCPGDCVGDLAEPFGIVDGADLAVVLGAWNSTDECANLDGAGVVDGGDLAIVLGAWGDCPVISLCPPSDHDCCTAGGPGCTDTECCETVCAADSFCCVTAWDALCVGAAESLCGLDCPDCPVSDHDCFTTGAPGCTDTDCCAAVCAADSFCCAVAWDGLCVNSAFSLCGAPECPFECTGTDEGEPCGDDTNGGCNVPIIGDSTCCFANGGVGCDDAACQDAVCSVDSFCCAVQWDGLCADQALTLCPDICQLGVPQFGSISCGETICGTAWADGSFRDTDWYVFNLDVASTVTLTLSSQLPMVFGVLDATDCALVTAINPFATTGFCGTASIEVCLPAGETWLFAAPNAFNGFPCGANNDYSFSVECGGECVPPACGEAADHDCFTTGTPFCTDEECCLLVCGIDPFCCDVAWDGLCVGSANSFCVSCDLVCTGTDEGEPCGSDTNGGCNSVPNAFGAISCGETICGTFWADGSFRDTDWFEFTLESTTEITLTGEAEFGFVIGVVDTGGIPDCSLATQLNPFAVGNACSSASATGCLDAGTWWAFIAPSVFNGLPCDSGKNDYSLTLNCGGECVPPSNCCSANGGLGCDDAVCTECVCGQDAFCCDVQWDGLCAAAALPGGVCAGSCPCGG